MKQSSSLAVVVFLAGAVLLASPAISQQDVARPTPSRPEDIGATPGHLPKVHYVPSRAPEMTYPMWIESSMALHEDGTINTTLMHPEGVKEIEAIRAMPQEGGCVQFGPVFEDIVDSPSRSTPEEAVKSARLVIFGKVTEKSYGFKVDVPGQLLRVVPEEVLKGQAREVPAYFVFLPIGTFNLGNLTICKTDSRYSEPPAVGDEVLLFVPPIGEWQQDQREPFLELLDDGGLVTVHADGKVALPKRYQATAKSALPTKDALLGRVRATAGRAAN
jgi:hypothetical protein